MATAIYNYLGFGRSTSPTTNEGPETIRALPANWYTSSEMYELERRAIFSRKWLILTHEVRLKEAGDFLRYSLAGFDFVVSRDRSGKVNAFHNVCRHRAYPVVEQDKGTAKIFSCRYHGWSYGLNGKLAKAPGYQDLDGFDKSQNGLFPIHVRVDVNGFIWVNLDAKKTPEIPWEADFEGVDQQDRFDVFDFGNYEFDHMWSIEADYNWKIAADNYNECYHCKTTHPDVPDLANLDVYDVTPKAAQILHDAGTTDEQKKAGLQIASTYYWPYASMTVTSVYSTRSHCFPTNDFIDRTSSSCKSSCPTAQPRQQSTTKSTATSILQKTNSRRSTTCTSAS
jgi:phenylpropionate dioxygenase-like ring-hydroxylating dioxygenase large terminal subunit